MPCKACNTKIKEHSQYLQTNGIVNRILCKTCGMCTYCHLGIIVDHKIEPDYNYYDITNE